MLLQYHWLLTLYWPHQISRHIYSYYIYLKASHSNPRMADMRGKSLTVLEAFMC